MLGIIENIRSEHYANIDKFSQGIIVSQLESLLHYSERFYDRQFLTRATAGKDILFRLEKILNSYFEEGAPVTNGLPNVQLIADALNVSPNYLSRMLKTLTGRSTQQHIHDRLIEKAKEWLSSSNLSIGEIAYDLGFEHPQSFTRLFKKQTHLSPEAFRASLN